MPPKRSSPRSVKALAARRSKRLTLRTPIGKPRVQSRLSRLNRRSTLAARQPATPVDPQSGPRIETVSGRPSVRDPTIEAIRTSVHGHEFVRNCDDAVESGVGQVRDRGERIEPADEQD